MGAGSNRYYNPRTGKWTKPKREFEVKRRGRGKKKKNGCYVATSVYGSYDCPEVWTLRRFRDDTLANNFFGVIFIKVYYAISPTLVKLFSEKQWFQHFWKERLDKFVANLNNSGVSSEPYVDKE